MQTVEAHPFPPILTPHATVMMMGTFPPAREKWAMEFHYPNFQNDMWRIYGLVFFDDVMYFQDGDKSAFNPEKIRSFLKEKGIASCPTVRQAIREQGNAADRFLKVVEAVDLEQVLVRLPRLEWICTTGGKATEILLQQLDAYQGRSKPTKLPKTNTAVEFAIHGRKLQLYRLPSSSRAYPLSLQKKAIAYRRFFELSGVIGT